MPVLLRHPDGTELNVLISARMVRDDEGKVQWFEGSLQDVSARIKAETEMKRAERLEVIGQLAAGIAHDFNNILAGIHGFAEYLTLKPHEDATVAAEKILLATNRAVHIVDGLLSILGTEVHTPTNIRLDEFARSVCSHIPPVEGKCAEIDLEVACGELEIQADPERLEIALLALIDNAVRASAGHGRVVVRTGLGPVRPAWVFAPQGEISGNWAFLSVIDHGCGMEKTTLDRIFDPYFTTREFGAGAGLGLTRVLGIAREQGGFVGVSSLPDQGTTVTIYLSL
jgi:signal transduction histidine kinase